MSAMDGYGLKMEKTPRRTHRAASGWVRRRIDSPPTYAPRCSQKTPRKNPRNGSKISIKKYHHSPTLGVKSDSVSWTPYVRAKNSHELPAIKYDMPYSAARVTDVMATQRAANGAAEATARLGDWRSYERRISGGRRRIGYMDR